jgi:hypothetical protein
MVLQNGVASTQYLFRAVLPEEESDIRETGALRIPEGLEVKYFTLTIEDAERYAHAAATIFNEGPYRMLRALIENVDVLPVPIELDRGIRAIVLDEEGLANVGAPELLHVCE